MLSYRTACVRASSECPAACAERLRIDCDLHAPTAATASTGSDAASTGVAASRSWRLGARFTSTTISHASRRAARGAREFDAPSAATVSSSTPTRSAAHRIRGSQASRARCWLGFAVVANAAHSEFQRHARRASLQASRSSARSNATSPAGRVNRCAALAGLKARLTTDRSIGALPRGPGALEEFGVNSASIAR